MEQVHRTRTAVALRATLEAQIVETMRLILVKISLVQTAIPATMVCTNVINIVHSMFRKYCMFSRIFWLLHRNLWPIFSIRFTNWFIIGASSSNSGVSEGSSSSTNNNNNESSSSQNQSGSNSSSNNQETNSNNEGVYTVLIHARWPRSKFMCSTSSLVFHNQSQYF